MRAFLQAVGLTILLVIFTAVTVLVMYIAYILGIGLLIAVVIFILYHIFKAIPSKSHL
jgi:hypothetical protein